MKTAKKTASGEVKKIKEIKKQEKQKQKIQRGKIRIDTGLCKGCRYCVLFCPKGVIGMDGENKKLNPAGFYTAMAVRMEDCTGCAICARMCPEVAIEVWAARD